MLSFSEKQHLEIFEEQQHLEEKLILFNQGKKDGQIVFMAGGAGSGKGFAIKNFLDSDKFKIRDVDAWKVAFMHLDKIRRAGPKQARNVGGKFSSRDKQRGFSQEAQGTNLSNLDLKNGKDVFKLHQAIKKMDIEDKTLNLLMKDMQPTHKPNILFDITAKSRGDIKAVAEHMIEMGYEPKNIHVVWVLTNYSVAVNNNAGRDRVVPAHILLQTHEGAMRSMLNIVTGGKLPGGADGRFDIVLNNRENTIFHTNEKGEALTGSDKIEKTVKKYVGTPKQVADLRKALSPVVIKSFSSIQLKREGKPMGDLKTALQAGLFSWISANVPSSAMTGVGIDADQDRRNKGLSKEDSVAASKARRFDFSKFKKA
jgi:hypothetical protein